MQLKILRLVFASVCLLRGLEATADGAGDGKRVALVVGVSRYENGPDLSGAARDASAVAEELKLLGYQVYASTNPTKDELLHELVLLRLRSQDVGTVVFYFSGHGVQHHGESHLLLKDTEMRSDTYLSGSVPVRVVFKALSDVPRQKILVLDACRSNPILTDELKPRLPKHFAPAGSFIAYSAQPGGDAFDGSGGTSPFTAAFLEQLRKPAQPIEVFFRKVRLRVVQLTDGRQVPWTQSSVLGHISF